MSQARIAGVGMVPFTTPSKAQTYDVMGERAAKAALADAGISYDRVQQAFASYIYGDSCSGQEALYRVGLTGIPIVNVNNVTPEGTAEKFIRDGDNTYGGRVVVNPSGGLLSKGHPIGATGLAQCAELVWQLRRQAAGRQVEGARLALQHNVGLGGTAVVTLYENVG